MKKLKTYIASYPTRGTQSLLIKNCATAAEARKKFLLWHQGGNHLEVEPLNHSIERVFPDSAKFSVDGEA